MKHSQLEIAAIRRALNRMEETIIFALIERAQFKTNAIIYKPGVFRSHLSSDESLMGYLLRETEIVHARMRRYTSPQDEPFFPDLPDPVLPPRLQDQNPLRPNSITVNDEIRAVYERETVPTLCRRGDDGHYGSSSVCDVTCLQAISGRVHYAKFVAESKYQDDPATYDAYIEANNEDALMSLITDSAVEANVLGRVHRKAEAYGQEPGVASTEAKISARIVTDLYSQWVIPLTKKVEILYLMAR